MKKLTGRGMKSLVGMNVLATLLLAFGLLDVWELRANETKSLWPSTTRIASLRVQNLLREVRTELLLNVLVLEGGVFLNPSDGVRTLEGIGMGSGSDARSACLVLAKHFEGEGSTQNLYLAEHWYRRAARLGSAESVSAIARIRRSSGVAMVPHWEAIEALTHQGVNGDSLLLLFQNGPDHKAKPRFTQRRLASGIKSIPHDEWKQISLSERSYTYMLRSK